MPTIFPIMLDKEPMYLPYDFVFFYEAQIMINHAGQTVAQLHGRSCLSSFEMAGAISGWSIKEIRNRLRNGWSDDDACVIISTALLKWLEEKKEE